MCFLLKPFAALADITKQQGGLRQSVLRWALVKFKFSGYGPGSLLKC